MSIHIIDLYCYFPLLLIYARIPTPSPLRSSGSTHAEYYLKFDQKLSGQWGPLQAAAITTDTVDPTLPIVSGNAAADKHDPVVAIVFPMMIRTYLAFDQPGRSVAPTDISWEVYTYLLTQQAAGN